VCFDHRTDYSCEAATATTTATATATAAIENPLAVGYWWHERKLQIS
jgi:hypothetical protein